jgi:hypothetical protein
MSGEAQINDKKPYKNNELFVLFNIYSLFLLCYLTPGWYKINHEQISWPVGHPAKFFLAIMGRTKPQNFPG